MGNLFFGVDDEFSETKSLNLLFRAYWISERGFSFRLFHNKQRKKNDEFLSPRKIKETCGKLIP